MILQGNRGLNLLLNGLLHFVKAPNGRCGVEVPAETNDYNQSIFCMWSTTMEQMDSNQQNHSFLEQGFGSFDGSALITFSNRTVLEESLQSLLQKDLAETAMALDHLQADIPVPHAGNEREKLLNDVSRFIVSEVI